MHKYKIALSLLIFTAVLLSGGSLSGCKDSSIIPPVDQDNISLIATYSTNASTNGVFVYPINFRNFAFIADGTNGMQIIDVNTPNSPDSVNSYSTGGSANDITVAKINGYNFAFVSDYNTGLVITEVSNPFNIISVGTITGKYTNTCCVDAAARIAYIGQAGGTVTILDISALPSSPTILNSVGSNCNGVFVNGNRLYIANGSVGFSIYDVSNPSVPVLLSTTNTTGTASSLVVIQNYAYVADAYNGTLIFNVSNSSSPSLLSRVPPNGQVLGVAVNNNTLYTADNSFGVESINVSSPGLPTENGSIRLNSSASAIVYFSGYLFLAAAEGGMAILQPTY